MMLTQQIYQLTKQFPDEEKYGLSSQMRRCAVSIPSNISEGAGRSSRKEFAHFLSIAMGSCYELTTQLKIAVSLEYLSEETLKVSLSLVNEIKKMMYSFSQTLSQ